MLDGPPKSKHQVNLCTWYANQKRDKRLENVEEVEDVVERTEDMHCNKEVVNIFSHLAAHKISAKSKLFLVSALASEPLFS